MTKVALFRVLSMGGHPAIVFPCPFCLEEVATLRLIPYQFHEMFPTPVLVCSIRNKFALPWLSESHVALIFFAVGCH